MLEALTLWLEWCQKHSLLWLSDVEVLFAFDSMRFEALSLWLRWCWKYFHFDARMLRHSHFDSMMSKRSHWLSDVEALSLLTKRCWKHFHFDVSDVEALSLRSLVTFDTFTLTKQCWGSTWAGKWRWSTFLLWLSDVEGTLTLTEWCWCALTLT